MRLFSKAKKGFSIVEAILASALLGLIVMGLTSGLYYSRESTAIAGERMRAVLLAQEGLEAVRNIRDANFGDLKDGRYALAIENNQWKLVPGEEQIDEFKRQIIISTIDANTKRVICQISWQSIFQREGKIALAEYLTNWRGQFVGGWANPVKVATLDFSGKQDGLKIQVLGDLAFVVRNGGTPDFLVVDISLSLIHI
mgnify:CR=1 FL=1